MKKWISSITSLLLYAALLTMVSCRGKSEETPPPAPQISTIDHVHQADLPEVRLGDGVPLSLEVSIRWKVAEVERFKENFTNVHAFNQLILQPRALELARMTSNEFASVDSVFSSQRNGYVQTIKERLINGLGEPGIEIKEIILSNVGFPQSYTKAMEEASLKQRQLERIRLQNIVDIEQSAANKLKAEADAKVAIARAEADGRIQKINAKMETSRRQSELAKAETQAQVEKLKVAAEAEKRRLMADADLEKQQRLQALEIERQRELDLLAVEKERAMNDNEMSRVARMARICSDNPTYATYVVNKQLASKVDFAFLPANTDPNIFSNLIKTRMPLPGTRE